MEHNIPLRFKKLTENAEAPFKGSEFAAGEFPTFSQIDSL
jgi:hypothetical protein